MMEQRFDEYKAEFSRVDTTNERRNELIVLMQEDLRERIGQSDSTVVCLDRQKHSIDSVNVEDLYAIDGFLRSEEGRNQLSAMGDIARLQNLGRNNYGPNNPYSNN